MKNKLEELVPEKLKIDFFNSKLEGKSNFSNLNFKYTAIGDELEFITLGRGKNRFPKILNHKKINHEIPNCIYFSKCGGCKAQHLKYEDQFFLKTKEISKLFKENFQIELELFPASKIFHYRNRMDFAVFPEKIGLRQESNFRNIIDIDDCKIQSLFANDELKRIKNLILLEFSEIAYNRKTETGFLKYITIRTNSNETDKIIIFTFIENFLNQDLKNIFIEKVKQVLLSENIVFCFNRTRSENSCEGKFEIIKGNEFYVENFFGKEFNVPFNSFSQPNLIGFLPILNFINQILSNKNHKTLIDLFCGNGFFSLLFGEKFETLIGYDVVDSSILIANEILKKNYPNKNILFQKKDLLSSKEIFDFSEFQNSILILDPPRNGIGEILIEKILNSNLKEFIYVSCNPETQLEDLKKLSVKFKPFSGLTTDPYPQTPHLESVVYLNSF